MMNQIVRQLDAEPTLTSIAHVGFRPPRSNERLPIDVHVQAEPVDGQLKHGAVRVQLPSRSPFEVVCDEKAMIKGTDGAGHVYHGQIGGLCDEDDLHLHIDSDEPQESAQKMVRLCTDACMALQTVVNATPLTQTIILNGEELA